MDQAKRRGRGQPPGRKMSVESPRVRRIYEFICAYKEEHDGNSPTMRQIGDACHIKSSSVVKFYLDFLKERGLIKMTYGKASQISVVGGAWRPPATPFLTVSTGA